MILELRNITKIYEEDKGVKNFNLTVKKGEFVTLLGPSGCGKTTTLNLIGGFLKPDQGEILIENQKISHLPPEQRPVSTVFQNYALFPHMSVLENVAYGIRFFKKIKKKKALEEGKEFVRLVGLEGYEHTGIGTLSGGQQQRVALARSIATGAKVLLLDEPLSNLDVALRTRLRRELKELQRETGVTMIFVTHDQGEALSLSDRIVVMDHGTIVQTGTPEEVYYHPQSPYVANFVGKSNQFTDNKGRAYFVRPEDIRLIKNTGGNYRIQEMMFLGHETEVVLDDGNQRVEVILSGKDSRDYAYGDRVDIDEPKSEPKGTEVFGR
ncbi:ABC transporter ATP-binding protein [Isachenkonia alkalipeptolytica]|uniref:ABC-type quaternary amine transporter n=1 Tax=Isachenkonia alkalipeptolytica TaxID=2565777 RepID=A0AA43XKV0_9CLOT|nr:ABC transporter ATP-binding protein [Isachenkonia alkalipeptolytica]NBG88216.1 ABC transporter ATP-binding protein [Isachenkonia alkalipeptolytica]